MTLLYGAAVLILLWWLSKTFASANTAAVARAMKIVGGILALGGAVATGLRGRLDMAILLGGLAAWLFGWSVPNWLPFSGLRQRPTAAAASRVRSATIEMRLDHETGALSGTVLAGPFAGRLLDDLNEPDLGRLAAACEEGDPDGARLLEAYLDRRFPGRRKHAEGDRDPGPGGSARPGPMTKEEAYQVLGLEAGAGIEAIRTAHRSLMKKLHPDQGGSTYLAARVNLAKDILLDRHR